MSGDAITSVSGYASPATLGEDDSGAPGFKGLATPDNEAPLSAVTYYLE